MTKAQRIDAMVKLAATYQALDTGNILKISEALELTEEEQYSILVTDFMDIVQVRLHDLREIAAGRNPHQDR